ncbi:MAG TPA: hypothetical protein VEV87_04210, partial [Chitinophagaceae bacterium]|nr:hypothetical protein [Chitinophagaceae bacterium]
SSQFTVYSSQFTVHSLQLDPRLANISRKGVALELIGVHSCIVRFSGTAIQREYLETERPTEN